MNKLLLAFLLFVPLFGFTQTKIITLQDCTQSTIGKAYLNGDLSDSVKIRIADSMNRTIGSGESKTDPFSKTTTTFRDSKGNTYKVESKMNSFNMMSGTIRDPSDDAHQIQSSIDDSEITTLKIRGFDLTTLKLKISNNNRGSITIRMQEDKQNLPFNNLVLWGAILPTIKE